MNYQEIIEYLQKSDFSFIDDVQNYIPSPFFQMNDIKLRDYQKTAIERWTKSLMRGFIVLPTGAGKTLVGIKAIEKVNAATLIIVPTIDLMEQWTENLSNILNQKKKTIMKKNIKIHHLINLK